MPKKIEEKLEKEAKKKHLSKEKADAYVYGTLNKIERRKKTKERTNARKSASRAKGK